MRVSLHNVYSAIHAELPNRKLDADCLAETGGERPVGEPQFYHAPRVAGRKPVVIVAVPTRDHLRRFFGRVTVQPDGCWRFATLNAKGYGIYRSTSAHRYSYTWFVGPIPAGLHIDHLCFNKACVNPAHLEAVTLTENNRRGNVWVRTGRCMAGHVLTPENIYYYRKNLGGPVQRTCLKCRLASRRRWLNRKAGATVREYPVNAPLWGLA